MDGTVQFNQAIVGLFYKKTSLNWTAADNQLRVGVGLFLQEADTTPLVERFYFIQLEQDATFQALNTAIDGLLKAQVDAAGQFTLQPDSP